MKITIVYIDVKPECIDNFKTITTYNHDNSRLEAGNVRFDVLQSKDDPTKFALYEVFQDEAALDVHKLSEHYKKWAAAVADYMNGTRTKTVYQPIAFN